MTGVTRPPSTLFGVPLALEAADAAALRADLEELWFVLAGRPPARFEADVEVLATYWHPKLRGATVRDRLARLGRPAPRPRSAYLTDELALWVDEDRALLTVEGYLLLQTLPVSPSGVAVILSADVISAYAHAHAVYSSWAQFRLRDVVGLLRGEGPPLLPPVVGLLVLLLVNRSTAPERGLRVSDDREQIAAIDESVRAALTAFANRIGGKAEGSRDPRHFSLYGGYLLSEAARRLGPSLVRGEERVYLEPGREHDIVTLIARDLARRQSIDATIVGAAFDELVDAIRGPIGRLALQDSAFEQPANTRALRSDLLETFEAHRRTVGR